MGKLVKPKVFLVGFTDVDRQGLVDYLAYTGQMEFLKDYDEAVQQGISSGEAMCSLAAKLCYKSLVEGKNANITRTRNIEDNFKKGILAVSHLSTIEHPSISFIVTDCSRVFSHEVVRHRIASYSQTSGRYVRLESIDFVWDDILEPCRDLVMKQLANIEDTVYLMECKLGLRKPPSREASYYGMPANFVGKEFFYTPEQTLDIRDRRPAHIGFDKVVWVPDQSFPMDKKKKLTSAIRRIAPNGQANEIFITLNLRTLRHIIMMRTARHAEREIRDVFGQVYRLLKPRFPLLFSDAVETMVDGFLEISGMKQQPYERMLKDYSDDELRGELSRRGCGDGIKPA